MARKNIMPTYKLFLEKTAPISVKIPFHNQQLKEAYETHYRLKFSGLKGNSKAQFMEVNY